MADSLPLRQRVSLFLFLDSLGRNYGAVQGYLTILPELVPLALFMQSIFPVLSAHIPPESPVCKLSLVLILSVEVLEPILSRLR